MRYKIGDQVKVRRDLVVGRDYNGYTFLSELEKCRGKILFVFDYIEGGYKLTNAPITWTEEMFETLDVKGLNSLENGMTCELRDGVICKLLENGYGTYFLHKNGILSTDLDEEYYDDLTSRSDSDNDIMKISVSDNPFDFTHGAIIWEREEAVEMTLDEIEEALGYKVKIVGS